MAINANYVLRETAANLTRNITLTVASVLTVFVTLSIVGTIVLVRQGAQNLTDRYQDGVEFIVYVEPDISDELLAEVKTSLSENPGVREIEYIDRDETYADFRELFEGQDTMLENVRASDLP
jgi:cell division transport system permease protein